jgi:hypothetical protein
MNTVLQYDHATVGIGGNQPAAERGATGAGKGDGFHCQVLWQWHRTVERRARDGAEAPRSGAEEEECGSDSGDTEPQPPALEESNQVSMPGVIGVQAVRGIGGLQARASRRPSRAAFCRHAVNVRSEAPAVKWEFAAGGGAEGKLPMANGQWSMADGKREADLAGLSRAHGLGIGGDWPRQSGAGVLSCGEMKLSCRLWLPALSKAAAGLADMRFDLDRLKP